MKQIRKQFYSILKPISVNLQIETTLLIYFQINPVTTIKKILKVVENAFPWKNEVTNFMEMYGYEQYWVSLEINIKKNTQVLLSNFKRLK